MSLGTTGGTDVWTAFSGASTANDDDSAVVGADWAAIELVPAATTVGGAIVVEDEDCGIWPPVSEPDVLAVPALEGGNGMTPAANSPGCATAGASPAARGGAVVNAALPAVGSAFAVDVGLAVGALAAAPPSPLGSPTPAAPPSCGSAAGVKIDDVSELDDVADAPGTGVVTDAWAIDAIDGWLESDPAVGVGSPDVAGASCAAGSAARPGWLSTPTDVATGATLVLRLAGAGCSPLAVVLSDAPGASSAMRSGNTAASKKRKRFDGFMGNSLS